MKMLEYYQIKGRVSSLSKMYLRIQKKKTLVYTIYVYIKRFSVSVINLRSLHLLAPLIPQSFLQK